MTRSNGPHDQAPQWRQPTRAAYEQSGDGQQPNWQYSEQEVDPNQVFQSQPPLPGQPAGSGGYPGGHDPAYQQNFAHPQGEPPPNQPYDQYQPGFDHGYAPQGGAGHAPYQPAEFAPQTYGAPGGQPSQHHDPNAPRGYGDQFAAPHVRPGVHDQAYDNSAYDLGNYMPAQTGPGMPAMPAMDDAPTPGFGEPGYRPGQNWDFGAPNYNNPLGGNPHHDQAGFGQNFDARHHGAITEHGDAYGDEHDDDFDYEYDDEEGGSGRKWLIAGSLVAAIVVGGGVAYGYNVMFSGPSGEGGAPIVKAEAGPAKVPPASPGGQKFDHTSSKLLGKLGGSDGREASTGTGEGNRVRSVSTVAIGPDGRLIIPEAPKADGAASVSTAASGQSADTPLVPGMTIVGAPPPSAPSPQASAAPAERPSALGASNVTPAPIQPTTAPTPATPKAEPAPARTAKRRGKFPPLPVRSGLVRPRQAVSATASVTPSGVAQANVTPSGVAQANVTPVVVPQARQAAPQAAPRPAPRAPAAATSAPNGFVAVLSTKRSRIDALTSFADMQQKYASILGGKIPAVRRADLSARGLGVMYRAGVGPPGSRQAAGQTCARLKAAGYSGCWVAPY